MANWQTRNVLTSAVEGPKYNQIGLVTEIWSVALTTALANGDTILGPTIPANTYLFDVAVDVGQLDSNGSPTIAFEAGYVGALGAFIVGSTTARAGGIQTANVAGTVGYTATTNTQVVGTITTGAATAKAGTWVFRVTYTANP